MSYDNKSRNYNFYKINLKILGNIQFRLYNITFAMFIILIKFENL